MRANTTTLNLEKPHFIKDKGFYKLVLKLVIPVTLQNIVVFFTQMLDTIMLGELGDVAMTSASLANQPFFLFNMLTFGLSSGAAVLTAQYWGKAQLGPVKKIISMMIRLSMIIGAIVMVVTLLFPEAIMGIYTKDPLVIETGASYLRIFAWAFIFFGFTNVFYIVIRSVELVKVAVISNFAALILNCGLNYLLIFGNFGFPKLGVQGAAIATLVARLAEFVVAIIYIIFFDQRLRFKIKDFLTFDRKLFVDMLKVAAPVTVNEMMWGLGTSMQSRLLGLLGTTAVAANSIIGVVQQLSTVAVFGIAGAAAVLIGKAIGEGNMQEARNRGYTFKYLALGVGVVVSAIILLSQFFAVDFYNVSQETKNLAHDMMYVAAIVGFFVSIASVGIVGILRGGGDTRVSLWIEVASLWGVAVPLAYFVAFVLGWPPVFVYAVMKIDEPVKSIMLLFRIKGTKWLHDVTRTDA